MSFKENNKKVLQVLFEGYPKFMSARRVLELAGVPESEQQKAVFYLNESGLVLTTAAKRSDEVPLNADYRITAKGIDFILED